MPLFLAFAALAVSAVGIGLSVSGAQQQQAAQQQQIQLEMQVQRQQQEQMQLINRRLVLQEVRNAQLAQSTARTNATAQGAQAGSGLPGGQAQIAGQETTALTSLNQNLQIGQNVYGLTYGIDQTRIAQANAGSTMGLGAGLTSLGGAFTNNLGTINMLGGQVGNPYNGLYNMQLGPSFIGRGQGWYTG